MTEEKTLFTSVASFTFFFLGDFCLVGKEAVSSPAAVTTSSFVSSFLSLILLFFLFFVSCPHLVSGSFHPPPPSLYFFHFCTTTASFLSSLNFPSYPSSLFPVKSLSFSFRDFKSHFHLTFSCICLFKVNGGTKK